MAWKTIALCAALAALGCGAATQSSVKELQRVRSGDVDVLLLSPDAPLKQGRTTFTLEFRRAADGALVDAGPVRLSASMPMPGLGPMFGEVAAAQRPDTPGRYTVTSNLGMAGTWRITVEWQGPAGPRMATFSTDAQ